MDFIYGIIAIVIIIFIIGSIVRYSKKLGISSRRKTRAEKIGARGEYSVASALGRDILDVKYVINDIIIVHNGKSSQIDHVMISKFGIFVIETKNLSGYIYGNEKQRQWMQVLSYGNVKHQFYNPIMQNETHIKQLEKVLQLYRGFISVIVFPRANLKNVRTATHVGNIYSMKKYIRKFQKELFFPNEINRIYKTLMEFKNNPTITEEEHVRRIVEREESLNRGICPWCGDNLVIRNGRYGQFYGCSNFPKCKFSNPKD